MPSASFFVRPTPSQTMPEEVVQSAPAEDVVMAETATGQEAEGQAAGGTSSVEDPSASMSQADEVQVAETDQGVLTRQPEDPLEHMIKCLNTKYPNGPLKVIISSAPCVGRSSMCQRLAEHFGLTYISAGEILRSSGVDVSKIGMADESKVSEMVMEHVKQAEDSMQGFVLDGFPRTRQQTSYLKEHSVVPTHVLVLKVGQEAIMKRNQQIADGELPGEYVDPKALLAKLDAYACHSSSALEPYLPVLTSIDAMAEEEAIWQEMERTVRMQPRSTGPRRPPRVLILGPPGTGVREHTSRLAARLGAVFVDGAKLNDHHEQSRPGSQSSPHRLPKSRTTIDMPNASTLATEDALGAVGVRLRQNDCSAHGYVMCGFASSVEESRLLAEDSHLAPFRVVALKASADVCVQRLRHLVTDPLTGKVWTTRPKNEQVRKRLVRRSEHQPAAVASAHQLYERGLPNVLEALGSDGRCSEIAADGNPEDAFAEIVEFVERPLPLTV
mmetsp:Transcript_51530/g.96570  ORF Transcript_51530/g.96570 Transcript_51530/m.96570 type:complete len:499 (-) Transcript_51530:100-1596(-)